MRTVANSAPGNDKRDGSYRKTSGILARRIFHGGFEFGLYRRRSGCRGRRGLLTPRRRNDGVHRVLVETRQRAELLGIRRDDLLGGVVAGGTQDGNDFVVNLRQAQRM